MERQKGQVSFRNVIVHSYLEDDLEVVHRVLNERLDDFAEFAQRVNEHLADRSEP